MGRRKALRAAVVGCGRVGFLLERDPLRPKPCTHAGGIVSDRDFRLTAGCDIRPDRLAEFGKAYSLGRAHLYPTVDALLSSEPLDVLSIATWTESHDTIVHKACRSGVRAIICEKPMAVTISRARSMLAAARRHKTVLLINHCRRWFPEYRAARQAILDRRYGQLRHIQGCVLTSFGLSEGDWHSVLDKSGGGPLMHDGTHLLDIVFYLTGLKPLWVECRIERPRDSSIEHSAVGRMMLTSQSAEPGIEFCFEAGGRRRYFHFEVELWFDAGRLTIGNGILRAESSIDSRRYSGFRDLSSDPDFDWGTGCGTAEQVCMRELSAWFDGGARPQNTGEEAFISQEAIFAAYESAVRSRRIHFPYRPTLAQPLRRGRSR